MNIKNEFAYIDEYFDHISKEDLINDLIDCGIQVCEHEWKHQYEQYFGGLRYICKCTKCGSIKIE